MILSIFKNNPYELRKKILIAIKFLFYKNLSNYLFSQRYRRQKKTGFEFCKIDKTLIKEYKEYWGKISNRVETKTLQISYSISGSYNKNIIPENIFFTHIELTLNRSPNLHFLQNKSIYESWYKKSANLFPKCFLHKMDNVIYNNNLEIIDINAQKRIINCLEYPVVIKPNVDSSGGKNVYFVKDKNELLEKMNFLNSFVVQEQIIQSDMLNEFYYNLNTVRVCLYKSVNDNKFYIINSALRLGKDGSLDNVGDGGMSCSINENGFLNKYAVDYFGKKYYKHPNTLKDFGSQLPFYNEMCSEALKVCDSIINGRIVSLDMCLDNMNNWRIVEVNLLGNTIRFAQNAGVPFFGKFTDEVIEFCIDNHWVYQDQKLF